MKNLNETNKQGLTPELIAEIKTVLGKELDDVYTYKNDCYPIVIPGSKIRFEPFTKKNIDYKFDKETQILTVLGRNKWQRGISSTSFKLEIVGFKCKTTHIEAGYIYGNPIKINL